MNMTSTTEQPADDRFYDVKIIDGTFRGYYAGMPVKGQFAARARALEAILEVVMSEWAYYSSCEDVVILLNHLMDGGANTSLRAHLSQLLQSLRNWDDEFHKMLKRRDELLEMIGAEELKELRKLFDCGGDEVDEYVH
jgi:hypothetical protein